MYEFSFGTGEVLQGSKELCESIFRPHTVFDQLHFKLC